MKTVCIYHSRDLDGWMSAAIVKHWFNQQEVPNKEGEDCNTISFLGWDYGNEIPNLSSYDRVIMCDVAFPPEEMSNLSEKFQDAFIWIDHHISAIKGVHEMNITPVIKGLRDTTFAACELTWKVFFPNVEMPELVRLLGRYDCFGYVGTNEHKKVLEFQYGARMVIDNYEKAYDTLVGGLQPKSFVVESIYRGGVILYHNACTEAKQLYAKAFPIDLTLINTYGKNPTEEKYDQPVKVKFLCVNAERFNPMNFDINYHDEGYQGFACFWMIKDKQWQFSFYNADGTVDCSQIAKALGGGGHKGAAGVVVSSEILNNIIN